MGANMKRTAKNKLVPRGQQNRLHLNEVTQKGEQNRVLKSTKSTSPRKHTARNKLIPRSQQNRLHQRRLPKRSINVSQGHRNRPHQEVHCKKQICLKVIEIDLTNAGT